MTYLHAASHRLERFALDGSARGPIPLPELGSVASVSGQPDEQLVLFGFSNFTRPQTIYAFDLTSGTLLPLVEPELHFDPADFETRQVSFQADDGTRLLMFLVHRKSMALDEQNPTYLYGYMADSTSH